MSPSDIAGIFSRPFIVGHFLPAFFALSAGALLTPTSALPSGLDGESFAIQLLVIGAAALPLGLLLSNVHAHVVRTFSGEATERQIAEDALSTGGDLWWADREARRWIIHRTIGKGWMAVKGKLANRQHRAITKQQRKWSHWAGQVAPTCFPPPLQWRRFDEEFPCDCAVVSRQPASATPSERTSHTRSLATASTAPLSGRASSLYRQPAEERALIADARTEVAFFLNCALATPLVAAWAALVRPLEPTWWWLLGPLAVILAFMVFQRLAVTAILRALAR